MTYRETWKIRLNVSQSVTCGGSRIFNKRMESSSSEALWCDKDHEEQEKECAQALQLLKGHDRKQPNIRKQVKTQIIVKSFQSLQSQKDDEERANECVQALQLLKDQDGKQSNICPQGSQSQKDHWEDVDECVQALCFLKGHDGKPSNIRTQSSISGKPRWLEMFLRRSFFDPCREHPTGKNDLNQYCVDCDSPLCRYCLSLSPSPHAGHRVLKLYRYICKDVVLLNDLKPHFDCSEIQPFKVSRKVVLALTPLPHVGLKIKRKARCYTCKRRLFQYETYNYCSISCKVEAFSMKKVDSAPPFLSIEHPDEPK